MKTLFAALATLVALASTPALAHVKIRNTLSSNYYATGSSHTVPDYNTAYRHGYKDSYAAHRTLSRKQLKRLEKARRHEHKIAKRAYYNRSYYGRTRHGTRYAPYRLQHSRITLSGPGYYFKF